MAHPPRSKPPLRSSSGPPNPCITPSTETLVVVVNLTTCLSRQVHAWCAREARIASRHCSIVQTERYKSACLASLLALCREVSAVIRVQSVPRAGRDFQPSARAAPVPGRHHPASAADVRRALMAFGEEIYYGVDSVELVP